MNTTLNKQQVRFDETKQTFIDKLRGYQQFTDVNKVKEREEEIRRNAQRIKEKLTYELRSPRANSVNTNNGKSFLTGANTSNRTTLPNNISKFHTPKHAATQQLKLATTPLPFNPNPRQPSQQPSISLITTKFTTQQKYLQQQIQKIVNEISLTDTKYNSHKIEHSQLSRVNFMQLDNFEKYLIACQKEYQMEYNMVVDRSKEEITQYIQQSMLDTKDKHKLHLQSNFNSLRLIDSQCQMLAKGMTNQSQLCESDWCLELDKINQHILELNNYIIETRQQQTDRFSDSQWRIKQVQFACEDGIEQERKSRLAQEHKIYAVIQQLIQKVGAPII